MQTEKIERWQKYRLKDLDGYRERKREYAKTDEQRKVRREYMRKWRELNREKHNQLARESRQRNKHKHVGKAREYMLKTKYGITGDDYEKMFLEQKGLCAICSTDKPAGNRFHVDHCHQTGKVRRLLCSRCNGALGWFEKYRNNITTYADTTW